MKKIISLLGSLLLFSAICMAQAYEGKTEYDKKKQDAFIIQFHYPAQAVENAIIQKMRKMGYKGKEEKGIFNKDRGARIYNNAYITAISKNKMDYIFQVERKSRKEDDEAILYLIILKQDGSNAVAGFDAADMKSAKDFLNDLLPDVEAANLEIQIKDQEEVLARAERKLKGLQEDKTDLEKRLDQNKKDQENTQKEIEDQKQLLESLKLKRKAE